MGKHQSQKAEAGVWGGAFIVFLWETPGRAGETAWDCLVWVVVGFGLYGWDLLVWY